MEFIEGVTFLSEYELTDISGMVWLALLGVIFFTIFAFASFTEAVENDSHFAGFLSLLFVLLAFASFFTVPITCTPIPTGEFIYKVTINEDVNMQEFMQTYEIIDQDGLIYNIKLKE